MAALGPEADTSIAGATSIGRYRPEADVGAVIALDLANRHRAATARPTTTAATYALKSLNRISERRPKTRR